MSVPTSSSFLHPHLSQHRTQGSVFNFHLVRRTSHRNQSIPIKNSYRTQLSARSALDFLGTAQQEGTSSPLFAVVLAPSETCKILMRFEMTLTRRWIFLASPYGKAEREFTGWHRWPIITSSFASAEQWLECRTICGIILWGAVSIDGTSSAAKLARCLGIRSRNNDAHVIFCVFACLLVPMNR